MYPREMATAAKISLEVGEWMAFVLSILVFLPFITHGRKKTRSPYYGGPNGLFEAELFFF